MLLEIDQGEIAERILLAAVEDKKQRSLVK